MAFRLRLLALGVGLFVAACRSGAQLPPSKDSGAKSGPRVQKHAWSLAQAIRTIDWRSRAYEDIGDRKETFAVHDGSFEFAYDERGNPAPLDGGMGDLGERGFFRVDEPVFGDVTGDGFEEALIVCTLNTGGTGDFSEIRVYGMVAGQPVVVGTIPGGDRGAGGVRSAGADRNAVIVERFVSQPAVACCPSELRREIWRWDGVRFVEDVAQRTKADGRFPL